MITSNNETKDEISDDLYLMIVNDIKTMCALMKDSKNKEKIISMIINIANLLKSKPKKYKLTLDDELLSFGATR